MKTLLEIEEKEEKIWNKGYLKNWIISSLEDIWYLLNSM